ncbi:MAG: hypothetical protein AABY16_02255 [Nanoarchaeota archaeon]
MSFYCSLKKGRGISIKDSPGSELHILVEEIRYPNNFTLSLIYDENSSVSIPLVSGQRPFYITPNICIIFSRIRIKYNGRDSNGIIKYKPNVELELDISRRNSVRPTSRARLEQLSN